MRERGNGAKYLSESCSERIALTSPKGSERLTELKVGVCKLVITLH